MYVGITRAQLTLTLVIASGASRHANPSPAFALYRRNGRDDVRYSGGKQAAPVDRATGNARLAAMKAMLAGNK